MRAGAFCRWLFLLLLCAPLLASAEPYLAVRYGLKCMGCHVNPTGGGLRNATGVQFSQVTIPQFQLPSVLQGWKGSLGPDILRLGGDFRTAKIDTRVPDEPTQHFSGTEQSRLYGDVQIWPGHMGFYMDQMVAPGQSQEEERYVRLSATNMELYFKGGQFYLPFGWRLQDQSAFVRQLSGINMTAPDKGVELGLELPDVSAQLDYTDGPGNRGTVTGHQVTSQVQWLQSWGRIGGAVAFVTSSAGARRVAGLFGGTKTGPVAWLGEVDWVSDAGYPEGTRRQLASLLEADWLAFKGHNLKFTSEFLDPDLKVHNDHKVRYSAVYEYTPIAFIQLRAGYRYYGGIPQNNFDNRRVTFVELHALF
jgi:hypothetical protein